MAKYCFLNTTRLIIFTEYNLESKVYEYYSLNRLVATWSLEK